MSAKDLNALGLFFCSIPMLLLGLKPIENLKYKALLEGLFLGIFIGILVERYSKKSYKKHLTILLSII